MSEGIQQLLSMIVCDKYSFLFLVSAADPAEEKQLRIIEGWIDGNAGVV